MSGRPTYTKIEMQLNELIKAASITHATSINMDVLMQARNYNSTV